MKVVSLKQVVLQTVVVAVVLCGLSSHLSAQISSGTILGSVSDNGGAKVPNREDRGDQCGHRDVG